MKMRFNSEFERVRDIYQDHITAQMKGNIDDDVAEALTSYFDIDTFNGNFMVKGTLVPFLVLPCYDDSHSVLRITPKYTTDDCWLHAIAYDNKEYAIRDSGMRIPLHVQAAIDAVYDDACRFTW